MAGGMMGDFAECVLAWFDVHGRRDLPWQRSRDPYPIWISEIMLQQTQVQTVIPYFERFIRRFADVATLADAGEDDVLAHWSGLGYYARARNLHRAARIIKDEHGGKFPRDFDAVAALPGIGRSTAGAILSLAHGDRHAILDGNVKRVLARHAAVGGWPGRSGVLKQLWALAEERTPDRRVDAYNQAMMDLGSLVCARSRPLCDRCPVACDCVAFAAGDMARYPGRKPKKEKPLKQTTMVLATAAGQVWLERRPPSGIWGGLWSFPEVSDASAWIDEHFGAAAGRISSWDSLRHSFTHFDLDIRPVVVQVSAASSRVADTGTGAWFALDAEPPGGIAAPVNKLMESLRAEVRDG